jgi:Zn-finger nucleic acid-binding protein
MREVAARASPGMLIALDQCRRCGGIWCDKWELFPIRPEEAARVEPVDEDLLRAATAAVKKILYCPRCGDRLRAFRDPLLPTAIRLCRCSRCEGLWLNRGEFTAYKRWQGKVRRERLGEDETARRVADSYSDPNSWVTAGVRGIFAYPRPREDMEESGSVSLTGTIRVVVYALVRLVLGY